MTSAASLVGNAYGRGNQICVEPGIMRCFSDLDEIASCARLPAREMHLQNSERRGFVKYPHPSLCVELVFARLERKWIRTIGTTEWTPVREFGKKAKRLMELSRAVLLHVKSPGAFCPQACVTAPSRRQGFARVELSRSLRDHRRWPQALPAGSV